MIYFVFLYSAYKGPRSVIHLRSAIPISLFYKCSKRKKRVMEDMNEIENQKIKLYDYYDLDNSNKEPYAKAYYLINKVKTRFMLK